MATMLQMEKMEENETIADTKERFDIKEALDVYQNELAAITNEKHD